MSIIMPEESKMKVDDLAIFYNYLNYFVEINFANKKSEQCIEILGKIQGYLLVADKKKHNEYFDKFIELKYFELLKILLENKIKDISYAILKTICFLTLNIENENLIKEIYSSKIINNVISIKFKNEDELNEFLINFMKSLTLKLNKDNISYFYNYEINDFPILTTALSYYNSKNGMIRNVVRNIILQIIRIDEPHLRNFLTAFPFCIYYPHLIFKLREIIFNISKIDINIKKNINLFKNTHDDLIDLIYYISDLLSLNIESINFILINTLYNDIIFPIIKCLISNKREIVSPLTSLYILTLILYSTKTKLILNSLSIFLFSEVIDQNIFQIIQKSKDFEIYSVNIMQSIDLMIKNTEYADINDKYWKNISEFMKKETGMNLAVGKKEENNFFSLINDYLNKINEKKFDNFIQNEIFKNIKSFCLSNDDSFLLIINLIIYIIFDIYGKNNENNEENKEDIFNPLKICDFFSNIEKNSNKDFSFFENFSNLITESNTIRLVTNEIILSNIKNHISFFKSTINQSKEKIKLNYLQIFKDKTIKIIEELKIKISQKEQYRNLLYEYTKESYDLYIKDKNKKINDLITLPWILIPLIYYQKITEYPIYLYPNKNKNEILNQLIKIYYLFDIINFVKEKEEEEIINKKQFPLITESNIYALGKEYEYKEIIDEKACCDYIIVQGENKIKKNCYIIITSDTFYLSEYSKVPNLPPIKVKIIKKIPLRRLIVKFYNGNDTLLSISEFETNRILIINCYGKKNTLNVMNFLIQNKTNAIQLEYLLVISFLDDLISKINE